MRIQVIYWRGTTQCVGYARTYRGAMRIASRNQNKYSPTFWDGDRRLLDNGYGLVYEDTLDRDQPVYVVLGG